jgi:hypothetical protein
VAFTRQPGAIHADLQAKNILVGPDGRWQAIDPFTSSGDVNAEAALWAVVQDDGSSIEQRSDQLARATPLRDRTRLRAWCYVFAVAECRTSLPGNAQRIRDFATTVRTWCSLLEGVSTPTDPDRTLADGKTAPLVRPAQPIPDRADPPRG